MARRSVADSGACAASGVAGDRGVQRAVRNPEWQARLAAFQQGLQELGWIVGRTIRIEHRVGPGDGEFLRRTAAELVALAPDAIVVNGTSPMTPLLQATRRVPVVFVNVSDPVGAGFVASLARPGGDATGFTQFEYGMSGKWLELLKQIAPGLKRAAILAMPPSPALRSSPSCPRQRTRWGLW